MGGRLGDWWVGKEIEHTKFCGKDTVFFDTSLALSSLPTKVTEQFDYYYFNIGRDDFFNSVPNNFWKNVQQLLKANKYCTFDIGQEKEYFAGRFTAKLRYLRSTFPYHVIVMYELHVVSAPLNDWCIKITSGNKDVVWTADAYSFKTTLAAEYKKDIPGSQWLKENSKEAL